LNELVIGQDRAKKKIAEIILCTKTGIRDPRRPIGAVFLLGPTGVGKTELVKATAKMLFGDINAYTHISGSNFQNGHEVTLLLGSPPSYVGGDIEPVLSQKNIDRHDFNNNKKKISRITEEIKRLEEEKDERGHEEWKRQS